MRGLVVELQDPESPPATVILREYLDDVVSRYHGRDLTPAELESAVCEFPSDDIRDPSGLLWVAMLDDGPVGCVGLRLLPGRIGEVTRMFTAARVRRQGLGTRLMLELTTEAERRHLQRLRLDTRNDLIEARALYAKLGFREVPAFNEGPYAQHWFQLDLEQRKS